MNPEAPQLPRNENHRWFHPSNLIVSMINGIARMEYWRTHLPESSPRLERWHERIEERKVQVKQDNDLAKEMNKLAFGSLVNPEKFEEPYQEARRALYSARAQVLGERAINLREKGSRFADLRAQLLERRQRYNQKLARKAARRILQSQSR